MTKIELIINGQKVTGEQGQTIQKIAKDNGIHIPTLCHDERVAPEGACGVCVVEAEKSPRLMRACSTIAADGMNINTNSPRVQEARNSALELLLSDHTGDCRPPCALACPAQTDCKGYVGLIANGAYKEALALIREKLPLPGCIGRVCPAPCEEACRRELVEEPISIAHLKTFAADTAKQMGAYPPPKPMPSTNQHVAIIGGGPGGLTAANFLRLNGHAVTIYDAMPQMGGMLRYGIPSYRLPREILDDEISQIEALGVEMKNNIKIGKDITFDKLQNDHDATLVAIGAWSSAPLRCTGEDLKGVVGGIDFLRDVSMGNITSLKGKNIAVVGGGNTAMDACRTAKRLGANSVTNIYRRTKAEMPAQPIEIKEAEEEGVIFKFLTNPLEIVGENGIANSIRLQKMQLGEPDASGRRSPVPIEGAEESINIDLVLLAIGQNVNPDGLNNLNLTKWRTIVAHEKTFATNIPKVFAIGDATNNGASIAIEAIGEARRASQVINNFLLKGEIIPHEKPFVVENKNITAENFATTQKSNRATMPHTKPDIRNTNFDPVNHGFSEEQAKKEAHRCLECGCSDYFNCKLLGYANQYNITPSYEGEKTNAPLDISHKHIIRNPEKCILCGLCIRVCEQSMKVGALGFDGRGFGTIVKPAFDEPLSETDCESCGQCVALCPTGALTEKLPLSKNVPLPQKLTHSTCVQCGNNCALTYVSHGSLMLKAQPNNDELSLLCETGRFKALDIQHNRITKPMIRKNDKLTEASMEEALNFTNEKIKTYNPSNIAIAISGTCTNEAINQILSYAKTKLKTENIYAIKGKDDPRPEKMPKDIPLEGNTQGLTKAGVNMETGALKSALNSGEIKALITFGGTVPIEWCNKLDLLVIADTAISDATNIAHVLLPFAAPFETSGTITTADGKQKQLTAAIKPAEGFDVFERLTTLI